MTQTHRHSLARLALAKRVTLVTSLMLSGCAMTPPPTPPDPPVAVAPAKVIVEVKPAPGLPRAAAIGKAQDDVIASLPAGRVTVVQRYSNLPLLALDVDPALVDTLQKNPIVVRVSPDEMRSLHSK